MDQIPSVGGAGPNPWHAFIRQHYESVRGVPPRMRMTRLGQMYQRARKARAKATLTEQLKAERAACKAKLELRHDHLRSLSKMKQQLQHSMSQCSRSLLQCEEKVARAAKARNAGHAAQLVKLRLAQSQHSQLKRQLARAEAELRECRERAAAATSTSASAAVVRELERQNKEVQGQLAEAKQRAAELEQALQQQQQLQQQSPKRSLGPMRKLGTLNPNKNLHVILRIKPYTADNHVFDFSEMAEKELPDGGQQLGPWKANKIYLQREASDVSNKSIFEELNQSGVCNTLSKPLVIVALGPSGGGKTHTLFGDKSDSEGLVLQYFQALGLDAVDVQLSQYDLEGKRLRWSHSPGQDMNQLLKPGEPSGSQIVLKQKKPAEAVSLVKRILSKNRATQHGFFNDASSRSHVLCKFSDPSGQTKPLYLLDAAGVETWLPKRFAYLRKDLAKIAQQAKQEDVQKLFSAEFDAQRILTGVFDPRSLQPSKTASTAEDNERHQQQAHYLEVFLRALSDERLTSRGAADSINTQPLTMINSCNTASTQILKFYSLLTKTLAQRYNNTIANPALARLADGVHSDFKRDWAGVLEKVPPRVVLFGAIPNNAPVEIIQACLERFKKHCAKKGPADKLCKEQGLRKEAFYRDAAAFIQDYYVQCRHDQIRLVLKIMTNFYDMGASAGAER